MSSKNVMDREFIHVLLVDDDEVDILNVRRAFKRNGIFYPFSVALSSKQALDMLRGNGMPRLIPAPQIILLDLNMPGMNGVEFLKELRNDSELRNLIVFVLTTSADEGDILQTSNLNVAGYFLKHLDFDDFSKQIKVLADYWQMIEYPE